MQRCHYTRAGREMNTAKKRNLFEEIREGLEAYRDRPDTLPRHEFASPDAGVTSAALVKSARKARCRRGPR